MSIPSRVFSRSHSPNFTLRRNSIQRGLPVEELFDLCLEEKAI